MKPHKASCCIASNWATEVSQNGELTPRRLSKLWLSEGHHSTSCRKLCEAFGQRPSSPCALRNELPSHFGCAAKPTAPHQEPVVGKNDSESSWRAGWFSVEILAYRYHPRESTNGWLVKESKSTCSSPNKLEAAGEQCQPGGLSVDISSAFLLS